MYTYSYRYQLINMKLFDFVTFKTLEYGSKTPEHHLPSENTLSSVKKLYSNNSAVCKNPYTVLQVAIH